MPDKLEGVRDVARVALAGVRLFNGVAALFAPEFLARRLGADPEANGALIYILRLFGIRTVIIGAELLLRRDEELDEALRIGLVIHASDTASAALAGLRGHLPPRAATMATAISAVNVVLAIVAQAGRSPKVRLPGR